MAALLLIDIQDDFVVNGKLAILNGEHVVEKCNALRKSRNFDLVALSQDFHPEGHASFASTNEGAKPFEKRYIRTPATTIKPKVVNSVVQVMWPDHCVQGSQGAEFCSNLVREQTDLVVQKGTNPLVDSYSAFGDEFEGQFENTVLFSKLQAKNM